MSNPESKEPTLEDWPSVALCAHTMARDPTATIKPEWATPATVDRSAVESLPMAQELSDSIMGVEIVETLGTGGMGVVRWGIQQSLQRDVAVKTLRPEISAPEAVGSFMREAWVTSRLEHPNIVPLYDAGLDDDGRPHLVMRRIDGTSWHQLMNDPARVRAQFAVKDVLEWHLRVLIQVCNALDYAHSRRIIHRDIKPGNVIIGEYGEVYLLDWGIAVSLEDDGTQRLPLARDAHELAGTPAYMAPEMLGGMADRLSERTDVYLLGATLYRALFGHPPHQGASAEEILTQVLRSDPPYRDVGAGDLANVCRRALAPEPADRYSCVAALRTALQTWLDRRSSEHLTEQASEQLAKLVSYLKAPPDDTRTHRRQVYRQFGACRFAFQHALQIWPDNEVARDGLERALTAAANYEIDTGNQQSAEALIEELEQPSPQLIARFDELCALAEADKERRLALEALEADQDQSRGRRARLMVAFPLLLLGVVMPFVEMWAERALADGPSHAGNLLRSAGLMLLPILLSWRYRRELQLTTINRRVTLALIVGFATMPTVSVIGPLLGLGPLAVQSAWLLVMGSYLLNTSVAFGYNLVAPGFVYLVTSAVSGVYPQWLYPLISLSNASLAVGIWRLWHVRSDHTPPEEPL